MPHTTPTYSAQFVFIGTALRGERAPKCLKHYFRLNTLPFDAKSPWRIPYDELPPLVSGSSSLRWQKWKEPGPGEGVNVSILPSARFLLSGEETRSAPWAKWNTDVIVICVFLEDSVTTEKRLQQVRVSAPPPASFIRYDSRDPCSHPRFSLRAFLISLNCLLKLNWLSLGFASSNSTRQSWALRTAT